MTERRPRLTRTCPMHLQLGCDWTQVTSEYVGGPEITEDRPRHVLFDEAAAHMQTHYGPAKTWIT